MYREVIFTLLMMSFVSWTHLSDPIKPHIYPHAPGEGKFTLLYNIEIILKHYHPLL